MSMKNKQTASDSPASRDIATDFQLAAGSGVFCVMNNQEEVTYGLGIECIICGEIEDSDQYHCKICSYCARLITNQYHYFRSGEPYPYASESDIDFLSTYYGYKPIPSPIYKKKKIGQSIARKVFEKDQYRCVTCGGFKDLCVDHIIPESKGGTLDLENLQTLCRSCNSKKGAKYE